MKRKYVTIERKSSVAIVTMDNPATLNAMDDDMGPQLAGALEGLSRSSKARALVLTGAGGVFSGGGNLKNAWGHLRENPGQGASPVFTRYTRWVHRVLMALTSLEVPVIAAVEGAASGAGLAWLLASDLVVVSAGSRLVPGFLQVGLVPAAGVTWHLPRLTGNLRASEILMLNREIPLEDALHLGVVDEITDRGKALERAVAIATELGQGPGGALTVTKCLLNQSNRFGLAPHLEHERSAVLTVADTTDFSDRVSDFMERRRK